ncbi:retromer complex subunit Vps35, partial [Cryomyces antarcticus]
MDRLSAYAARESETEEPEQRKKTEAEAAAKLLERLRISKETKKLETATEPEQPQPQPQQQHENGDVPDEEPSNGAEATKTEDAAAKTPAEDAESPESNGDGDKKRPIPDSLRLFEVFYEQVVSLVKMQRLPIQDTTALLVSLAGLAL